MSGLTSQVSNCPSLKTLITIGSEVSEDEKKSAADVGLELFTFQEVEVLSLSLSLNDIINDTGTRERT